MRIHSIWARTNVECTRLWLNYLIIRRYNWHKVVWPHQILRRKKGEETLQCYTECVYDLRRNRGKTIFIQTIQKTVKYVCLKKSRVNLYVVFLVCVCVCMHTVPVGFFLDFHILNIFCCLLPTYLYFNYLFVCVALSVEKSIFRTSVCIVCGKHKFFCCAIFVRFFSYVA